eukprot:Hpha_TRINITY_DN1877_c0_g2::TRINITY_DN1877_c0_g2_i1::g.170668::m.170668/K04959/ITPR2; inositol 1,4,5-triphosphate receptor type 2
MAAGAGTGGTVSAVTDAERGNLLFGDYFLLHPQHSQGRLDEDAMLSVEWLGPSCYPVVLGGETARPPPRNPKEIVGGVRQHVGPSHGPPDFDKRVFTIEPITPLTGSGTSMAVVQPPGDDTGDRMSKLIVTYGQPVCLRNVWSNRYLCTPMPNQAHPGKVELIRPKNLASVTDDGLDPPRHHWVIHRRGKGDETGEPVPRSTPVRFSDVFKQSLDVEQLPPELGFWAAQNDKTAMQHSKRELVSLGHEKLWQLTPYDCNVAVEAAGGSNNAVRCLDTVVLFHKECDGIMVSQPLEGEDSDDVYLHKRPKNDNAAYSYADLPRLSAALWSIEGANPWAGGPVCFVRKRYRLKHVCSGRYLTLDETDGRWRVTTTSRADDVNSLLIFLPIDAEAHSPREAAAEVTRTGWGRVQFSATGRYLHSDASAGIEMGGKERGRNSLSAAETVDMQDVYAIRVAPASEREAVLTVRQPVQVLKCFNNMWGGYRGARPGYMNENQGQVIVGAVEVICSLIRFLSDEPMKKRTDLALDPLPRPHRALQRMLFESAMYGLVFEALKTPLQYLTLGDICVADANGDNWELLRLYRFGFRLIGQMVRGVPEIAESAAAHIPFLEQQLQHKELNGAAALVQIIGDNRSNLDKLTPRQLEYFCFLVPMYGRSPQYLELLSACCVCHGEAVEKNQRTIARCLAGPERAKVKGEERAEGRQFYVNTLRVTFPLLLQGERRLLVKGYSTFPEATVRKVQRFLSLYAAEKSHAAARGGGVAALALEMEMSSSESCLSSSEDVADVDMDDDGGHGSDVEDEGMEGQAGLGGGSHYMRRLYRSSAAQQATLSGAKGWARYAAASTLHAQGGGAQGWWVWSCRVGDMHGCRWVSDGHSVVVPATLPSASAEWKRRWLHVDSGGVRLSRTKGGAVLHQLAIPDIVSVLKGGVEDYNPPSRVRGLGVMCVLKSAGDAHTGKPRVMVCSESMEQRSELLDRLRKEVRDAEKAIEETKALGGDPIFAERSTGGTQAAQVGCTGLHAHLQVLLEQQRSETRRRQRQKGGSVQATQVSVAIGKRGDCQPEEIDTFLARASEVEVQYLMAQLSLACALCVGNHTPARVWLQRVYPRNVVLAGIMLDSPDERAPCIRAKFCDLAVNLWLRGLSVGNGPGDEFFLKALRESIQKELDMDRPRGSKRNAVSSFPSKDKKKSPKELRRSLANALTFTTACLRVSEQFIVSDLPLPGDRTSPGGHLNALLKALKEVGSPEAPNQKGNPKPQDHRPAHQGLRAASSVLSNDEKALLELKLQTCRVFMALFDNRKTADEVREHFKSLHAWNLRTDHPEPERPDELTSALFDTILLPGSETLFVVATRLIFRNLSDKDASEAEEDEDAQKRLALLLQLHVHPKYLEGRDDNYKKKSADLIRAFYHLLDGSITEERLERGTVTPSDLERLEIAVMGSLTKIINLIDRKKQRSIANAVQAGLDSLGLSPLVLQLIESRAEKKVAYSLELMIAMMKDGNSKVQASLSQYFLSRNDEALFTTMRERMEEASKMVKELEKKGEERRMRQRVQEASMKDLEKREEERRFQQRSEESMRSAKDQSAEGRERQWLEEEEGWSRQRKEEEEGRARDQEKNRESTSRKDLATRGRRLEGAKVVVKDSGRKEENARLKTYREKLKHIQPVLRVLQLFSEGHNEQMQEYIRVQEDNVVSHNLVLETFQLLMVMLTCRRHDEFTCGIIQQAFVTMTEYCQGPCRGNQEQLIDVGVAASVNRVLTKEVFADIDMEDSEIKHKTVSEIVSAALVCLQAVLEGSSSGDRMMEAVQRTLSQDKVRDVVQSVSLDDVRKTWIGGVGTEESAEVVAVKMVFDVMIVLKMIDRGYWLSECDAYQELMRKTGCIEILRDGRLERIYFRISDAVTHLSEATKEELLRSVKRDTPTARISDFFSMTDGLIAEIEYYSNVFAPVVPDGKWVTRVKQVQREMQRTLHNWENALHNVMLTFASLSNLILLINARHSSYGLEDDKLPVNVRLPLLLLALLQAVVTLCLLSDFWISRAPLLVFHKRQQLQLKKTEDQKTGVPGHAPGVVAVDGSTPGSDRIQTFLDNPPHTGEKLRHVGTDWTFLVGVACVLAALLGVRNPFFLSFHLLTVSQRNPTLRNVISAVTSQSGTLVVTAGLAAVIIWYFSVLHFTMFRDKFKQREGDEEGVLHCDGLASCFQYLLANAVRAGGGVGDLLEPHSWTDSGWLLAGGLLSNFGFFVIIQVILLNIMSGVIIDTFAKSREEKERIEADSKGSCFICGIESTQFDRQTEGGFEDHVKNHHNMWNYVYFLYHLRNKEQVLYTGPESHVFSQICERDTSFFPLNKAITLEGRRDDDDDDPLQLVPDQEQKLQEDLRLVQTNLRKIMKQWTKQHDENRAEIMDSQQMLHALDEREAREMKPIVKDVVEDKEYRPYGDNSWKAMAAAHTRKQMLSRGRPVEFKHLRKGMVVHMTPAGCLEDHEYYYGVVIGVYTLKKKAYEHLDETGDDSQEGASSSTPAAFGYYTGVRVRDAERKEDGEIIRTVRDANEKYRVHVWFDSGEMHEFQPQPLRKQLKIIWSPQQREVSRRKGSDILPHQEAGKQEAGRHGKDAGKTPKSPLKEEEEEGREYVKIKWKLPQEGGPPEDYRVRKIPRIQSQPREWWEGDAGREEHLPPPGTFERRRLGLGGRARLIEPEARVRVSQKDKEGSSSRFVESAMWAGSGIYPACAVDAELREWLWEQRKLSSEEKECPKSPQRCVLREGEAAPKKELPVVPSPASPGWPGSPPRGDDMSGLRSGLASGLRSVSPLDKTRSGFPTSPTTLGGTGRRGLDWSMHTLPPSRSFAAPSVSSPLVAMRSAVPSVTSPAPRTTVPSVTSPRRE